MSDWLQERLQKEVLVVDGAMGTMLQNKKLPAGACPEEWNLTRPEVIKEIHLEYCRAGADIITTNTFGATRCKLKDYGLAGQVKEINRAGVWAAREAAVAAGGRSLVAASVGPLGKFVQPLGELSFTEVYEEYLEQCRAVTEAGADLIILETFGDLGEMRAALLAAKTAGTLPVVACFTFDETRRTFTGTDPETAAVVVEGLGASAVGVNCSVGPDKLVPVVQILARSTNLPVLVSPNAGMPQLIDGQTVFRETPAVLAEYADRFVEYGANLLGSCCGSTPAHTAAIAGAVRGRTPKLRRQSFGLRLASRVKTVTVAAQGYPVPIGERINPTGRKQLAAELRAGSTERVRREALTQTEAGAVLLDVNVGVAGIDQIATMEKVLHAVQTLVDTPLVIDSTDPAVIEKALQSYHGKALINSVNGEEASLAAILPLAKRYGAAILGLTLDEQGIPDTAAKRLAIARKIVRRAEELGIPRRDVIMDCLVLTVSAQPAGVAETLQAIKLVKAELGITTSLGVSNVSFGLPNRPVINHAFFAMALGAGLDAAIMNVLDEGMMEALRAAAVLTNRDVRAERYIDLEQARTGVTVVKKAAATSRTPMEILYDAVLTGDKDNILGYLETALQAGQDGVKILNQALIPAIEEVGRRYGAGIYFLPQLMMAGETMTVAFDRLRPELAKQAQQYLGTIVMATVQGDIHDIGKNIVAVLLANHGFKVIDLGKNVPNREIIDAALREQADLIGLSALMTTTMVHMEDLIKEVKARALPFKIMVGGAAVTRQYAQEVGAHGYAEDAVAAVETAKALIAVKGA